MTASTPALPTIPGTLTAHDIRAILGLHPSRTADHVLGDLDGDTERAPCPAKALKSASATACPPRTSARHTWLQSSIDGIDETGVPVIVVCGVEWLRATPEQARQWTSEIAQCEHLVTGETLCRVAYLSSMTRTKQAPGPQWCVDTVTICNPRFTLEAVQNFRNAWMGFPDAEPVPAVTLKPRVPKQKLKGYREASAEEARLAPLLADAWKAKARAESDIERLEQALLDANDDGASQVHSDTHKMRWKKSTATTGINMLKLYERFPRAYDACLTIEKTAVHPVTCMVQPRRRS